MNRGNIKRLRDAFAGRTSGRWGLFHNYEPLHYVAFTCRTIKASGYFLIPISETYQAEYISSIFYSTWYKFPLIVSEFCHMRLESKRNPQIFKQFLKSCWICGLRKTNFRTVISGFLLIRNLVVFWPSDISYWTTATSELQSGQLLNLWGHTNAALTTHRTHILPMMSHTCDLLPVCFLSQNTFTTQLLFSTQSPTNTAECWRSKRGFEQKYGPQRPPAEPAPSAGPQNQVQAGRTLWHRTGPNWPEQNQPASLTQSGFGFLWRTKLIISKLLTWWKQH